VELEEILIAKREGGRDPSLKAGEEKRERAQAKASKYAKGMVGSLVSGGKRERGFKGKKGKTRPSHKRW